ncbi:MAG: hypothetical protein QOH46_4276 [Solirubrobacteraceae bacterium]|jgi:hypothetical protein|nr:hypothetical protein [Solirubrobacteraceae bacterium]
MSTPAARPRRSVAVYADYADAQRAVDHLSDHGFPVERVAIVGHGLRYVEQVAGRMTTGTAALIGAAQGAALGALFGLGFGLIFTISPHPALPLLVLYGIVSGALLGALFGAVTHAATGGARDFTSVSGIRADRYEILVDEEVAGQAADLLRTLDASGTTAPVADHSGAAV